MFLLFSGHRVSGHAVVIFMREGDSYAVYESAVVADDSVVVVEVVVMMMMVFLHTF